MNTPLHVLLVEDSADDALLIVHQLREGGYDVTAERVETAEAMRAALDRERWDLIICDYQLPHFSGPAALKLLQGTGRDLPFIIVSGTIGEEVAVATMKAGANDYLMKGRLARLVPAVERELREAIERRERRRMEVDLHASEVRFRRLFEAAKDGILILNATTGTIVDVNPFLLELLGLSREQLVGEKIWNIGSFRALIPDRAGFMVLREHAASHFEDKPLVAVGGRRIDVEFVSAVYPVKRHTVMQCNFRDITERRQAELAARESQERLREEEARFRALVEKAHESVSVLDRDGWITYASPSSERVLGYRPEELIGHNAFELVHPDDLTRAQAGLVELLQSSGALTLELRGMRRDGQVRWMEVTGTNLLHIPSVGGMVLNYRDITERKQAEDAVRRSEAELKEAQRIALIGSWQLDVATNRVVWTEALYRMFGLDPSLPAPDYRGHPALFTAESWQRLDAALAHTRETGEPYELELEMIRTDGSKGWMLARGESVRDEAGGLVGLRGTAQDVTERKQADLQRIAEQRVLELLVRAASLPEALDGLTREYEGLYAGMKCSVLLLDADGRHLRHGAAPSLPADYNAAIDGIEIGPGVGSCGTAAYTGRPVIVSDIAHDPLWAAFTGLAQRHGLGSCWSMPILGEAGKVLGTLALYYHEPRTPQPDELEVHKRAAYLASLAILQHRVRDALQKSEERFRNMAENTSDWIWEVNEEGVYTYASPRIRDLLGYEPEEVLGRSAMSLMPADEAARLVAYFTDRAARRLPLVAVENVNRHKDGHPVIIETSAVPIFDGNGMWRGYRGIDRDITERKQAEEQLQLQNVLLSTVQEAAIDGILVVDENDRILSYNHRFIELWYIPEPLVAARVDEPVLQCVTAQLADPSAFLARVRHLYAHRDETGRDELLLADGRTFDRYSAPMVGARGRYYGRVWYFRDITGNKRAAAALQESEALLRDTFEHAPVGIALSGLDGGFMRVNEQMGRLLGYTREELLSRRFQDVTLPEDMASDAAAGQRLLRGEIEVHNRDKRYVRRDGGTVWTNRTISLRRSAGGQPLYFIDVVEDISARKQAEEKQDCSVR